VEAVAGLVQGVLLAYVRDDLTATPAALDRRADRVRRGTLLPAAPWCPPVNAAGRFAAATVDDFDQPEDAKMLVCLRLLVACTDRLRAVDDGVSG
jgi:hypothetical protein